MATIEIPVRKGKAARVKKGQVVKVINTKGQQVVDTWAFNADDLHEFMSMEHSRVSLNAIIPKVGGVMVTNKRRPILTDPVTAQSVHEHPGHRRQRDRFSAAGQHSGQPCIVPGRDGLRRGLFRLPARHDPDQRHIEAAHRSAFRSARLRVFASIASNFQRRVSHAR